MASGGDLKATFDTFSSKTGKDGKECTSKDMTRWFKDSGCFGKACSSNSMDIAHSAARKGKGFTYKMMDDLCQRMAKEYGKDKGISDVEEAKKALIAQLSSGAKKAHGATKQSKTGGVDKMTDASQYTGAHKERFGADGKGKGIDGREERSDGSGYVGNYKGEGSYAKKK